MKIFVLTSVLTFGLGGNVFAQAPAARVADTTSHGGQIVLGFSTVLIGGMPAARVTDLVVCPQVDPPGIPHVGGPIATGSATVLIGGKSAAHVGSTVTESGPPSTIVIGAATVFIGG